MKDIKEIIANNLIELRKQNNLTQNDLAKKLKYSDNTISRWEHAEITPSIETLQKISEIYSIPIEDLLKENITGWLISGQFQFLVWFYYCFKDIGKIKFMALWFVPS